ncbi:hypothetical protein FRB99_000696 [Tulasnella sp. 403]|nr:hypothetical protein FRB99_000696 [Tulasnella sp. 403]
MSQALYLYLTLTYYPHQPSPMEGSPAELVTGARTYAKLVSEFGIPCSKGKIKDNWYNSFAPSLPPPIPDLWLIVHLAMDTPSDTTKKTDSEEQLVAAMVSLEHLKIKRSSISFPKGRSEVGSGGFSVVHRATLRKGVFSRNTPIAVKKLHTHGEDDDRLRIAVELMKELKIWAELKHRHVLPLLGFYVSPDLRDAWVISPLAELGNLCEYLETVRPTPAERLALARDTAMGLEYMHTRQPPVRHGDIKSLNVLIMADRSAVLCDFGLVETVHFQKPVVVAKLQPGGTARYWSPEFLDAECHHGLESDVWAWGCLLYEVRRPELLRRAIVDFFVEQIVTGLAPYNDLLTEAQVLRHIGEKMPPASLRGVDCPANVKDLLGQSEILQHCRQAIRKALPSELDSNLENLEAELMATVTPLQRYHLKRSWLVFPEVDSLVGTGGFGAVHRATMQRNRRDLPQMVAVKKLKAVGGKETCLRMTTALFREIIVWAKLQHQNIIPFIGFSLFDNLKEAWLVSPLVPDGDITGYLRQTQPTEYKRLELALDTARGLGYLHSLDPPVCHGDIKPANVLISAGTAMLCDFGLAKVMEGRPSGMTTSTFNQCGTLAYESPELLLSKACRSKESDVWAWGCLLQEIFSEKPPYHWALNIGAIINWISTAIPPAVVINLKCPDYVKGILLHCWERAPTVRITIEGCTKALEDREAPSSSTSDLMKAATAAQLLDWTPTISPDARFHSDAFGRSIHGSLKSRDGNHVVAVVRQLTKGPSGEERSRWYEALKVQGINWAVMHHPNIAPFMSLHADDAMTYSLSYSQYPDDVDLPELLSGSTLDDAGRHQIAKDIADGLLYLHTRNPPIYHGHLTSRSVSINKASGRTRLRDYGFASVTNFALVTREVDDEGDAINSWRYSSPEVVAGEAPTQESDVWSWGCVVLELFTSSLPYKTIADAMSLREAMKIGTPPAPVDELTCPPRIHNLLGLCWKPLLRLRSSISEVIGILSGERFRFVKTRMHESRRIEVLKVSRDGTMLALAMPGEIECYQTETLSLSRRLVIPEEDRVRAMEYSLSGRFLIVGTFDGQVLLFDLQTGHLLKTYSSHTRSVTTVDISSCDEFIVSGSLDKTVRAWHTTESSRDQVWRFEWEVRSVSICTTSRMVAVGLASKEVHVYNLEEGTRVAWLRLEDTVIGLWWSPTGRTLFCRHGDYVYHGNEVRVDAWDVTNVVQVDRVISLNGVYASVSRDGEVGICVDLASDVRIGKKVAYGYHWEPAGLRSGLTGALAVQGDSSGIIVTIKMLSEDTDLLDQCMTGFASSKWISSPLRAFVTAGRGLLATPLLFRATLLETRFERSRDVEDLDKAIACFRKALHVLPTDHPSRSLALNNLAAAYHGRTEQNPNSSDLNNAILYFRETLELRDVDDPDRPWTLAGIGGALMLRYNRESREEDLAEAIELLQQALDLATPSHGSYTGALHNLATALQSRFTLHNDMSDLDRAIDCCHEALKLRPPGDIGRPYSLLNLAITLGSRYRHKSDISDLDVSIELLTESLRLLPPAHPFRISSLVSLGAAHGLRLARLGELHDLDLSIAYLQEVRTLQPHEHPDRCVTLTNLSASLTSRFTLRGDVGDLTDAISCSREVLTLPAFAHLRRHSRLLGLANILVVRYNQTGDIADINDAVGSLQEALEIQGSGDIERAEVLSVLASTLCSRFTHQGNTSDLETALKHHQEALTLRPVGHPARPLSLLALATTLGIRFQSRLGSKVDLDDAIMHLSRALELLPNQHSSRSMIMTNLAVTYSTRYNENRNEEDLDNAIRCHLDALELRPLGHTERSFTLNALAGVLVLRFDLRRDFADLTTAINRYREAVELCTTGHPLYCKGRTDLAMTLVKQHEQTTETLPFDIQLSIEMLESACTAIGSPPVERLRSSYNWVALSRHYKHPSITRACRTMLDILDMAIARSHSLESRHSHITTDTLFKYAKGIVSDAAACAIEEGQVGTAVELLERGRAIILTQIGRYRTPLDELRAVNAELAGRFEMLNRQLESSVVPSSSTTEPSELEPSYEDKIARYGRLTTEWTHTVAEIRGIPGFSTFLQPTPFEVLQKSAEGGPVIVINISNIRSDAVIITPSPVSIKVVPLLDASPDDIARLAWRVSTVTRSPRDQDLYGILEETWEHVVKDVMHVLQTEIKLPRKSRVWWYPTGLATRLPLHAAGIYKRSAAPNRRGAAAKNVPDNYVSSYTPTLGALIRARQNQQLDTPPRPPKVLVIAQPETPSKPPLLSVAAEVTEIQTHVSTRGTVTVLNNSAGTREAVLSALPTHTHVHFSCHGYKNTAQPFRSHFALHNGPLYLLDLINQSSVVNGELAVLSACHSAGTGDDTAAVDEGLHLAGAMQFAGYKSVVGTLWAMLDADGPVVAKEFYKAFAEGGCVPAVALSKAVKELRVRKVGVGRWMNYVHFGV